MPPRPSRTSRIGYEAVSERLLTTRELAGILGLSKETVLRRWRAGEIPGYRLASNVLRFRESDVDAYLEARREGPDVAGEAPATPSESSCGSAPSRRASPDRCRPNAVSRTRRAGELASDLRIEERKLEAGGAEQDQPVRHKRGGPSRPLRRPRLSALIQRRARPRQKTREGDRPVKFLSPLLRYSIQVPLPSHEPGGL
jgi:excisionase family DNA binding protein